MFSNYSKIEISDLAVYSPRRAFSASSGDWTAPAVVVAGGDALADSMRRWRGSGGSGGTSWYRAASYNPILLYTFFQ